MNVVVSIILTLLVFTIIVTIHEWGHFIAARKCGVYVEEFSIGMGPSLYSRTTKKQLKFSIRLLPLGGYCKMKGEEAEEGEPDTDSFSAKKPWQRAVIVAAGPIMNFVLAFLVMLAVNSYSGYIERKVIEVDPNLPAYAAGMEEGDVIIGMNGEAVHDYTKVSFLMMFYQGGEITMKVKKPDGTRKTLTILPQYIEEEARYRIGFSVGLNEGLGDLIRKHGFFGGLGREIAQGFWNVLFEIEMTIRSIGMLFTGQVGMDGLTGPIGIVSVVNDTYTQASKFGLGAVLVSISDLLILISANLGVMNLFPIPGLDGSRLIFLLVEKIRRKPMSPKVENAIYLAGFVLLFGLMIVVAFNDILRLFH